jgi:DNA-binding MarR family transcriptional regulator
VSHKIIDVTTDGPAPEALAAVRAWTRLENARSEFGRMLEKEHGITGGQLAILRLVIEFDPAGVTLARLRERLVLHPATLGQLIDRLARRGFVELTPDPGDRRRRTIRVTAAGHAVCRDAPLAGPVRLRHVPLDPARLRRLADALDDAIDLFGWKEWVS